MTQPSHPELPNDLEALRAALDQCGAPAAQPAANPVQPIHANPKFEQLLHPAHPAPNSPDQLLEDLETLDTETAQAAKQQYAAKQQATRQRQQQAARIRQAEQWLQQLDQKTDEAAWFEAFAANYPSRIEAAIDYLG